MEFSYLNIENDNIDVSLLVYETNILYGDWVFYDGQINKISENDNITFGYKIIGSSQYISSEIPIFSITSSY